MTDKMRPYIIHQGDHLNKVAHQRGFVAQDVWDHEANSELKRKRETGDQLYPGDILHIPSEKEQDGLPLSAGTENRYQATIPTVHLALTFCSDDEPLQKQQCVVRGVLGGELQRETTADGTLEIDVPVLVREFEVYFPEENRIYMIRVGDMDPVDEPTGLSKRLKNLGLHSDDPVDGSVDEEEEQEFVAEAIGAFQRSSKLNATEMLDQKTLAALLGEHGS